MQCTQAARAAWCAGVLIALALTVPTAPAAAQTGRDRADERILIPSAGWHGRPIRNPLRDAARADLPTRPPRGWEAGPAALGTGTHRATGSQRVRELQWRLKALGYRPGPIDGIFGVRTRAAVAWFELKHGLRVDGRADFAVVRHLRDRTTPGTDAPEAPPARPAGEEQLAPAAPVTLVTTEDGTPLWAVIGLVLLAFAVGFAAVAVRQRGRQAAQLRPTRGIGYVRIADGRSRLDVHASAIEAGCADQGIELAGLVTDDSADDRAARDRPGLAFAFEQLEQGAADCLVVGRVSHLTRSPAELSVLLDTMPEAPLVVLNADPPPRDRGRWTRTAGIGGRSDG